MDLGKRILNATPEEVQEIVANAFQGGPWEVQNLGLVIHRIFTGGYQRFQNLPPNRRRKIWKAILEAIWEHVTAPASTEERLRRLVATQLPLLLAFGIASGWSKSVVNLLSRMEEDESKTEVLSYALRATIRLLTGADSNHAEPLLANEFFAPTSKAKRRRKNAFTGLFQMAVSSFRQRGTIEDWAYGVLSFLLPDLEAMAKEATKLTRSTEQANDVVDTVLSTHITFAPIRKLLDSQDDFWSRLLEFAKERGLLRTAEVVSSVLIATRGGRAFPSIRAHLPEAVENYLKRLPTQSREYTMWSSWKRILHRIMPWSSPDSAELVEDFPWATFTAQSQSFREHVWSTAYESTKRLKQEIPNGPDNIIHETFALLLAEAVWQDNTEATSTFLTEEDRELWEHKAVPRALRAVATTLAKRRELTGHTWRLLVALVIKLCREDTTASRWREVQHILASNGSEPQKQLAGLLFARERNSYLLPTLAVLPLSESIKLIRKLEDIIGNLSEKGKESITETALENGLTEYLVKTALNSRKTIARRQWALIALALLGKLDELAETVVKLSRKKTTRLWNFSKLKEQTKGEWSIGCEVAVTHIVVMLADADILNILF